MADPLEEQRNLMFGGLEDLRNFYNRPEAQELMNLLMGRARGTSVPFNQQVLGGMLGQNADSAAAGFASQREGILRGFANAGLSGSGLQMSALLDAQQRSQGQVRAGRREIQTRAELENFGAQERAQQQAQSYLADKFAAESKARLAEVDLRSQMYTTEQQNQEQAAARQNAPARPTHYGLSNQTLMAPQKPMGSVGPQGLWNDQAASQNQYWAQQQNYEQLLRQQIMDRAYLAQIQADWDSRYGG